MAELTDIRESVRARYAAAAKRAAGAAPEAESGSCGAAGPSCSPADAAGCVRELAV